MIKDTWLLINGQADTRAANATAFAGSLASALRYFLAH